MTPGHLAWLAGILVVLLGTAAALTVLLPRVVVAGRRPQEIPGRD